MRPLSYYVNMRDQAIVRGDLGLARSLTADLARHGYTEPPTVPGKTATMETTEPPAMERAVPDRPRKRRPEDAPIPDDE